MIHELKILPKVYRKCAVYGITNSEATDWLAHGHACGLFPDKPYGGDEDIVRMIAREPQKEAQIQGQMSIFEMTEGAKSEIQDAIEKLQPAALKSEPCEDAVDAIMRILTELGYGDEENGADAEYMSALWDVAEKVKELPREAIAALKAQPEIVRCKDCKHRDAETNFCEGRGRPMQLVPDDGFCDKGERSEE